MPQLLKFYTSVAKKKKKTRKKKQKLAAAWMVRFDLCPTRTRFARVFFPAPLPLMRATVGLVSPTAATLLQLLLPLALLSPAAAQTTNVVLYYR